MKVFQLRKQRPQDHSPQVADFIAKHDTMRLVVSWSLLPIVGVSWMTIHLGPAFTIILIVLILGVIGIGAVSLFRITRLRGYKT